MGPSELLRYLSETLERLEIRYLVTGSMATIAYGEPRFTNDIDVVVELTPTKVSALCQAFPAPDFFCYEPAVSDAVRTGFQFNILHPGSGMKIGVLLAGDSAFDRSRLQRGVRVRGDANQSAWFASPEDVIVKKLQDFREGGSDKHIRDILGVLKVRDEALDRNYIAQWCNVVSVQRFVPNFQDA